MLGGRTLYVLLLAFAIKIPFELIFQPVFTVHNSGTVVITGASSGIGEDAAAAIHALGIYTVFAGVRKPADAARLEQAYPGIKTLILDVTDVESIGPYPVGFCSLSASSPFSPRPPPLSFLPPLLPPNYPLSFLLFFLLSLQ
jgi:hypothetical protein